MSVYTYILVFLIYFFILLPILSRGWMLVNLTRCMRFLCDPIACEKHEKSQERQTGRVVCVGLLILSPETVRINPIWHGGGGHDGPPKCFWPLCPNALLEEAETWWLLILTYGASKKVIFGCLGYPVLPWQRVCQGVLEIFWSYRSICFLITKF